MRHIIILFATILFASCSAMTSDFSEMKRAIQKPEIVFENPKIEESSKVTENNSKVEEQENTVEEDNIETVDESEQQETVDDSQEETDENILIKEPDQKIEIEKTNVELQEDSIVEEEKTTEAKEDVIEEVLIENDNLKIFKINDTYRILNEDIIVEFTKEEVVDNDRFLWIIPHQSCVYESNEKLFFLDYNNFSEVSLEK